MEQQTQAADTDFDIFNDETESTTDAGTGEELTLSELQEISGRTFASKADALKHYQHLNSLPGNQTPVKA